MVEEMDSVKQNITKKFDKIMIYLINNNKKSDLAANTQRNSGLTKENQTGHETQCHIADELGE